MELPDSMDFAEPQDPKPAQPPAPPLAPTPLPVQQVTPPVVEPPQGMDAQQQADLESLLQTNQRMMQRDEQQQQAALMEQFRLAVEQDPDMLAQQQQMAREMGVEPETAAQNWEFVQRFQKQQQLRRAAEDARYPIVAEGMRTKNYAALTQDDIANLQRLEGFWSTAGAGWTMGDLTVERGYIGAKMASGYADIDDINRLREIDRQLRQLPKPQTVMQGIASGTLELAGQMKTTLPTAAAGGALLAAPAMAGTPYSAAAAFGYGFTATMFAQSAMIEGGNAYADYIERGFSEEDARTAAFGVGLLNGALEVVGFKYAAMPARKLLAKAVGKSATDAFRDQTVQSAYANIAKSVAKSVGPEVLTEMAQETITIAGGEWAKAQSRPELDQRFGSWEGIKGVAGEVYEVGVKTLESMVLLGMVPAVGTAMTDAKRIDQAKVTQQVLQGAINGTLDTKTLERAPDVLRSLVEQATQGKMDTLYISGKTLLDVLRKHDADVTASGKGYFKSARDQLAELFPEQIAKLDDAAANGYDLQFTTADISVKLAQKTGISQALLPHFRSDESGLSYAEAAAYEPELKKLVGQMEPQISEKAQADKQFSDSAREVRESVYQQLAQTGMPVDRARVGAELARRRAMLMAPGRQMLPKQWFDQYGFKVTPAQPQDVVLPPIPIPTRLQQPIVQPAAAPAPTPAPEAPAPAPVAPVAAAAPEAAPAPEMAPAAPEVAPAPAEAMAPEVAPAPAPAEAAAPAMTPEQEAQRMQLATAYAELFDPASTMTNEQKVAMVEELLTDPRVQLTEEEQAPLMEWLAQAQQVIAPPLPVAEDPTLPTPQEVGQMVEEVVQLEQQIQQAEAQPEAVVQPVAEAQPVAEVAPAVEPVATTEISKAMSLDDLLAEIQQQDSIIANRNTSDSDFEQASKKIKMLRNQLAAQYPEWVSQMQELQNQGQRLDLSIGRQAQVADEGAKPAEAAPQPDVEPVAQAEPPRPAGPLGPVNIRVVGEAQTTAWNEIVTNLRKYWDVSNGLQTTGVSSEQALLLADDIDKQLSASQSPVIRINKMHAAVAHAASMSEDQYKPPIEWGPIFFGSDPYFADRVWERRKKIAAQVMEPPAAVKPGRAKKQKQQLEQQLQTVVAPEGITELKDGARALAAGRITRDQWDALVNKLGKVKMVQAVPELSQMDAIRSAMPKGKKEKVMAPEAVPEGTYVGLRLDIPAKTRHGIDVVTVHKAGGGATAGAVIGFTNAAVVTDVEFAAREELVFRIAQEIENKDIAAIVKGRMKAMSPEAARALAQQAMTDPQWRQVGFNPKLHSYFFDRATGEPLASAEMVVQIGSLVLAKNAVTAPREQFLFSRTPATVAQMDADYLAAVERGDMETAQRMVDEAAKAAGFDLTPMYRGQSSPRETRYVGYMFTNLEDRAREYAEGETPTLVKVYLRTPQRPIRGTENLVAHRGLSSRENISENLQWLALDPNGEFGFVGGDMYVLDGRGGGTVKIPFRESDVKSSEPVTRDASGNVIPLSQRFDITKDSILFSRQSEGDIGGTYERNTRTIRLVNAALHDPNAKFATFTHEFTHWMFDDLQRAIEDGVADDGMKADFEALVRWGSDGKLTGEQYRALPFEQQRQVSEAVAYGYEQYAFEGADPGIEFRGIMRKVRDWFIAAWKSVSTINARYKRETGQDLPGLTPEVRQAFDRMLGARNQVEMAKLSRGAVALFQTKEEFIASGNSESDWDEYQQIQAERDQQFIDELIRESLQSLKWFSDGKTRSVAKLQRVVADVRKQIEAEIRPDLAKQRIYRVRHWLSTGERMNEDGSITRVADANHKLNLQDVVGQTDAANAILGELDATLLEAKSELHRADGMMVPELPAKFEEPAPPMAPATATKQEKAAAKKARKEWNDRREAAAAEMREARIPYLEAKHAREDAIKEAQRKVRQAEAELSKARAQVGRNEQLDAREHPLAKSLSEDGTPVQAVAEMFGYDSAQQMMNDLLNIPSLDDAVRDQATRIMQEEYGDLSTPEAIDETVYRTMYNRFQQKWSTSEYRFLLKRSRVANNTVQGVEQQKDAKEALIDLDNEVQQVRSARKAAKENGDDASVKRYDQEIKDLEADRRELEIEADGALSHRIMVAAAREAALLRLDNMALKQIKPGLFYAAARRNSREAHAAMTQGKFQEALTSKRNQIGNEATGFMADRVKRETNSAMRWFKRVLRGNDKTIARTRALDMVYAARAILVAFGIGGSEKQRAAILANAQEYLRQLREYYPDAATRVMSLIEDATKNNKKVGDLTYQEFRRLNEAVRELWALAERARSVELGNRKIEMSEIRQQIQMRAAELTKNVGVRPGVRTGVTTKQRFLSNLGNGLALMRRAESVFDKWDGAQPGVFTKILWRPIQDAVTAYRKMRINVYQKYAALVEQMQWDGKPIEAPELNYTFENKGALLAALLHSGNLSNLTKLLLGGRQRGEEWGSLDEKTGELDRSKWDMMVARLVSEGRLTQKDFDFVQGVWDILEELKPLAQRAYRKLFGDFFEEVKAQAFSIAFKDGTTKQYRGGYVPAKIDRDLALDMSNKVSLDELKEDFRYAMPKTMDGFTKARMKQVTKPLMLDLSIIGQHIDDVTKFVNIQPVLADVLRVLNDSEITASINSIDPAAMKNIIFPWLNRVASQRPGVSGMWPTLDKVVNTVRNRVGIGIMFLNISNATQQITGLLPALLKVRGSYMRGSMRRWSQGGLSKAVASKSPYMNNLMDKGIFEVITETNDLILQPNAYNKAVRWVNKNAYILQQKVQTHVNVIVWDAAYNQAYAELPTTMTADEMEAEAIQRADAAVRLTQGTTQPESVSQAEAGTPFFRTFTQFTSYFNTIYNLNATEFQKIIRELGFRGGSGKLFTTWLIGFAAPMIVGGAIARAFAGKFAEDEEDDDANGFLFNWVLDPLAKGAFAMIPFGGPALYSATVGMYTDTIYDDRMMANPVVNVLERGKDAVRTSISAAADPEREVRSGRMKEMLMIGNILTGLPFSTAARPASYAYGVATDQVEPINAADYLRGLVTGVPAEGTVNR